MTLTLVNVRRKSTHEDLPREPFAVVAAVDGAVVDATTSARGRPPARPGAAAAGRSVELGRVAAILCKKNSDIEILSFQSQMPNAQKMEQMVV